jgi:hypothetical protein
MNLELSDAETDALRQLLRQSIDADRFPLSPRLRPYKAILAKIDPPKPREPLPPVKPPGEPSMFLTRKKRRR